MVTLYYKVGLNTCTISLGFGLLKLYGYSLLVRINMGCCNNRLIGSESSKLQREVKLLIYVCMYVRVNSGLIMYLNIT